MTGPTRPSYQQKTTLNGEPLSDFMLAVSRDIRAAVDRFADLYEADGLDHDVRVLNTIDKMVRGATAECSARFGGLEPHLLLQVMIIVLGEYIAATPPALREMYLEVATENLARIARAGPQATVHAIAVPGKRRQN